jgi:hypothetical protein
MVKSLHFAQQIAPLGQFRGEHTVLGIYPGVFSLSSIKADNAALASAEGTKTWS